MVATASGRFGLLSVLLLLVAGCFGAAGNPEPAPPSVRAIPGITAADLFPEGCVSCHRRYPEQGMDKRLSTVFAAWTEKVDDGVLRKAQSVAPAGVALSGKHPDVTDSLQSIPQACSTCHGAQPDGTSSLGALMHAIHLTGGKDNHFITLFQGDCTHCHKFDVGTGGWRLPSSPEK